MPHKHPMLASLQSPDGGKAVSAAEAVRLIRDGDTVATGGFVGIGFAEEIAVALEELFLATEGHHLQASGKPKNLTLVYAAGQGDGKDRGLNHLGHEGLVKRVIGGHWGLAPKLQQLAIDNRIEAYNLPQGVITHLFRDIAAHRPGHITRVGMGTFVDPRNGGGKLNATHHRRPGRALIDIDGQECLVYKTFPIHVGIIRAHHRRRRRQHHHGEGGADARGARHRHGRAQFGRHRHRPGRARRRKRQPQPAPGQDPRHPGRLRRGGRARKPLADLRHRSTTPPSAARSGCRAGSLPPMAMSERKIIARRAAFELRANSVVNLGIGMPEGVAAVANEEKIIDLITLTAEPGVIGGIPASGIDFGAATNTQAIIDQPYQFDFYDGGGLDAAFLGLAQVDRHGNLNVSKFGPKLAGAGGFINISQNAKEVVFVGTFAAGRQQVATRDGKLVIDSEGEPRNSWPKSSTSPSAARTR